MSIYRIEPGERMSQIVIHNDTVYTAGQVALGAPGESVGEQTRDILARIDRLLAEASSDKSQLISATIWLASMDMFADMNVVWDSWVSPGNAPARACVEARLAAPQFSVEIAVIASTN